MNDIRQIPLINLIMSLSNTVDLVSPVLVNHHKQVAQISYYIAEEMDLPFEQRNDLLIAGALHDIGGLSLKDRIGALKFEAINPHFHAENSYLLLKMFQPFQNIANLVRFHHVPWDYGRGSEFKGQQVPLGSHIIHLADRVAVLIQNNQDILGQVDGIKNNINQLSKKLFNPELVEVFNSLTVKEYFWLDVISNSIVPSLQKRYIDLENIKMDLHSLMSLVQLFSKIIDFRSPFTANHSSGVAATAEALGRLNGFSESECQMIKIAGYLHDLGKLAIPTEILEKPAKLTKDEFSLMRGHTYYTYRALMPIGELNTITRWAAFHHEKLDGSGYPFHLTDEELPLGSKIMAVADVFTAIAEDRPYRSGMTTDKALNVLKKMGEGRALDSNVISLLEKNYDEINYIRKEAQAAAGREYQEFLHSRR